MQEQHPTTQQLQHFILGQLNEADVDDIALHLVNCLTCVEAIANLWDHPLIEEDPNTIVLNERISARVQQQLTFQIQRSNLSGTMVHMGVKGFLSVCAAFLRPMLRESKL